MRKTCVKNTYAIMRRDGKMKRHVSDAPRSGITWIRWQYVYGDSKLEGTTPSEAAPPPLLPLLCFEIIKLKRPGSAPINRIYCKATCSNNRKNSFQIRG